MMGEIRAVVVLAGLVVGTEAVAADQLRVRVELADGTVIDALRSLEPASGPGSVSRTSDHEGQQIEVLVEAADWGESLYATLDIRAFDARGRLVDRVFPSMLLLRGQASDLTIGADGQGPLAGVHLHLVADERDGPPDATEVHRAFFADRAKPSSHTWSFPSGQWGGVTCVGAQIVPDMGPVDGGGSLVSLRATGREAAVTFTHKRRLGDILRLWRSRWAASNRASGTPI